MRSERDGDVCEAERPTREEMDRGRAEVELIAEAICAGRPIAPIVWGILGSVGLRPGTA